MDKRFEEDLRRAQEFHGHLCTGIIFGVRLARAGLDRLGIMDPQKNRDFMCILEADRCLSDAVQSVTGCSLGKRRLKLVDYGKMAASFVDMDKKAGIRVAVNETEMAPAGEDQVEYWSRLSDEQLFKFEDVTVDIRPEDMPGKPLRSSRCEVCCEKIMDGREVMVDGKALCRACASTPYYSKI